MNWGRIESVGRALILVASTASIWGVDGASAAVISVGCADCPLRIPEFGSFGTTTSILQVDAWGRIDDLDVYVDLVHTFTGDLEIFVVGPDSTEVKLFDQFGFSGNDIASVTFDDEALRSVSDGAPPFGPGSFRPAPGVLADFDGVELHGTWSLRIVDRFPGDKGALLDWRLIAVTVPEPSTLTLLVLLGGVGLARRRGRASRRGSIQTRHSFHI